MEIEHKRIYFFYNLCVKNYKHGSGANF